MIRGAVLPHPSENLLPRFREILTKERGEGMTSMESGSGSRAGSDEPVRKVRTPPGRALANGQAG